MAHGSQHTRGMSRGGGTTASTRRNSSAERFDVPSPSESETDPSNQDGTDQPAPLALVSPLKCQHGNPGVWITKLDDIKAWECSDKEIIGV